MIGLIDIKKSKLFTFWNRVIIYLIQCDEVLNWKILIVTMFVIKKKFLSKFFSKNITASISRFICTSYKYFYSWRLTSEKKKRRKSFKFQKVNNRTIIKSYIIIVHRLVKFARTLEIQLVANSTMGGVYKEIFPSIKQIVVSLFEAIRMRRRR